jgi:hypothetical protein
MQKVEVEVQMQQQCYCYEVQKDLWRMLNDVWCELIFFNVCAFILCFILIDF